MPIGASRGFDFVLIFRLQAFIIGWTSDLVPKMVYEREESEDGSLTGYVNFSLSTFNVSDFNDTAPDPDLFDRNYTTCRYSVSQATLLEISTDLRKIRHDNFVNFTERVPSSFLAASYV